MLLQRILYSFSNCFSLLLIVGCHFFWFASEGYGIKLLVQPFDFILADEPISHLDENNAGIMGKMMMEEAKAQGAGVIVTSIGKHVDIQYNKTIKL